MRELDWLPTREGALRASRGRLLERVKLEGWHVHYDGKRGGGDTWRTVQRASPACGTNGCLIMRLRNVAADSV